MLFALAALATHLRCNPQIPTPRAHWQESAQSSHLRERLTELVDLGRESALRATFSKVDQRHHVPIADRGDIELDVPKLGLPAEW